MKVHHANPGKPDYTSRQYGPGRIAMNEVYEKITTPKLAMSARKFAEYLESASDEQLFHIHLYALADE